MRSTSGNRSKRFMIGGLVGCVTGLAVGIIGLASHSAPMAVLSICGIIFSLHVFAQGFRMRSYYALPTLAEYKMRHAHLVSVAGRVPCQHCGDTHRKSRHYNPKLLIGPTKHLCSQCGSALYRS